MQHKAPVATPARVHGGHHGLAGTVGGNSQGQERLDQFWKLKNPDEVLWDIQIKTNSKVPNNSVIRRNWRG